MCVRRAGAQAPGPYRAGSLLTGEPLAGGAQRGPFAVAELDAVWVARGRAML